MSNPKVLISVLNWNNSALTIKCVNSILKNIAYPEDCYKIVVVDNASIDNSYEEMAKAFPQLQVIHSPENLGFAGGHYLSYKNNIDGDFDLFWILNNDLVINSSSLPELVKAYQANGDGIYGSISVRDDDTIEFGGTAEVSDYNISPSFAESFHNGKPIAELKDRKTYWAATVFGFSMIVPISVIKTYGYMDDTFFMYYEEFEYTLRLQKEHKIKSYIVQQSLVAHEASTSFKKSNNLKYVQTYYLVRNGALLGVKFFGYKKHSYFKQDLKKFWKFGVLLIPSKILLSSFSEAYVKNYYENLGKYHFYINKLGKTIKPEEFL